MIDLTSLRSIYEEYDEIALKVRQNASPFAGIMGLGNDPRKDRCHMEFYNKVKDWLEEFRSSSPGPDDVYSVVYEILNAADCRRKTETFWFNFSAHGLVVELIPLMTPEQCRQLMEYYDAHFPKLERMPVHKTLYKELKKAAK